MQVIAESFALGAFRNIRANASDPLLREIVTLTARDEARHVAFGVIYVGDAVKRMAPAERAELEDFTAEALDAMVERRPGLAGGSSRRSSRMPAWLPRTPTARCARRAMLPAGGRRGSSTRCGT
jgi:hypothetical protein